MRLSISELMSNLEMGGVRDNESGEKWEKKRQEDYDRTDDFIDDTELAWEQQALVAKDGFFNVLRAGREASY